LRTAKSPASVMSTINRRKSHSELGSESLRQLQMLKQVQHDDKILHTWLDSSINIKP